MPQYFFPENIFNIIFFPLIKSFSQCYCRIKKFEIWHNWFVSAVHFQKIYFSFNCVQAHTWECACTYVCVHMSVGFHRGHMCQVLCSWDYRELKVASWRCSASDSGPLSDGEVRTFNPRPIFSEADDFFLNLWK